MFWRFLHETCGRRAPNKRIPWWILYNRKDVLAAFLRAYFEGDGCRYNPLRKHVKSKSVVSPVLVASTVSKTLALQIQQAFSRFGVFVKLYEQTPKSSRIIAGRVCYPKEKVYIIQLTESKGYEVLGLKRSGVTREIRQYLEDEDCFYLPVKRIRQIPYEGPVYNIETTSHTYLASNIVIHNCSYKLCRDYKMGDVSFSKSVLVIAASNSPETSEIVNRIPVPLRDRFMFIEVEPPSIEAWAEWMDKTYGPDSWDRAVLAYPKWKPSDFLANYTETSADTGWVPPATPRN